MEEKNQEVNTIDIEKLAIELGKEKIKLPNGKETFSWKQEELPRAVKAIKHLSEEGKPVVITGGAPGWLVSALTHTVHPCQVSLFDPKLKLNGKDGLINIPSLNRGENNPEGGIDFKVTEKGDSILINWEIADESGVYDENDLPKVVVPEISQGKAVYISGRGPNYLTVAIAEAYAHTNSSVSLNQPGIGYTCSITHSRTKKLGDLTKDPMVQEEIKEKLTATKETQQKSQDKEVDKKEGISID